VTCKLETVTVPRGMQIVTSRQRCLPMVSTKALSNGFARYFPDLALTFHGCVVYDSVSQYDLLCNPVSNNE
jgi:hypothetical protein